MLDNQHIMASFNTLSSPLIFDACLRLHVALRLAPPATYPLATHHRIAGRAQPVRHYGSVDVFLEALNLADAGDILVIDNGGRLDEGCIGDLIVLETQASNLSGIVVWGVYRDSVELARIDFPVFSLGAYPSGPVRLDPREPDALVSAHIGEHQITRGDIVFGDRDGVIFVPSEDVKNVLAMAHQISQIERKQSEKLLSGITLRQQLKFDDYLARHNKDDTYTFRIHLRRIGGEIEE